MTLIRMSDHVVKPKMKLSEETSLVVNSREYKEIKTDGFSKRTSLTIGWKVKSILYLCIFIEYFSRPGAVSVNSRSEERLENLFVILSVNQQPLFSCSQDKCLCQVRQNKTLSSPQNNLTEFQKNVPETEKCLRQGCEQAFQIEQREDACATICFVKAML